MGPGKVVTQFSSANQCMDDLQVHRSKSSFKAYFRQITELESKFNLSMTPSSTVVPL